MPIPTKIRRWGTRIVYLVLLGVFAVGLKGVWEMVVRSGDGVGNGGEGGKGVRNSTLGFEKIFVLNLPSRTDRRDSIALAAAVSGLEVEFVEGKLGKDIAESALPYSLRAGNEAAGASGWTKSVEEEQKRRKKGLMGCWRGHVDVLLEVVRRNLSTALVLEDDADWDLGIRDVLENVARGTRRWVWERERLVGGGAQESSGKGGLENVAKEDGGRYVDGILDFPLPLFTPGGKKTVWDAEVEDGRSPYGEGWDFLHLGHCGSELPPSLSSQLEESFSSSDSESDGLMHHLDPAFSVSIQNDTTVPEATHLRPHPFARRDRMGKIFKDGVGEEHVRLVQRPVGALCAQGYAVSNVGARRLLWRMGVFGFGPLGKVAGGGEDAIGGDYGEKGKDEKDMTVREGGFYKGAKPAWTWRPFDYGVRDWCDGYYDFVEGGGGPGTRADSRRPLCLAPNPPVFAHYYAPGGSSDILGVGGGYVTKTGTPYIRRSVRGNLGVLVGEEPGEVRDGWPDGGKGAW